MVGKRMSSYSYLCVVIALVWIFVGLCACSSGAKPSGASSATTEESGGVEAAADTDSSEETAEADAMQEEELPVVENESVRAFVDAFDQTSSGPIEDLRQDGSPSSYSGMSRGHEIKLSGSDDRISVRMNLQGDIGGIKWLMQDVFLVLDPEHAEEAASLIARTATDAYKATEDVDTQVGRCKVYINYNMISGRIAIDTVSVSCDDFRP